MNIQVIPSVSASSRQRYKLIWLSSYELFDTVRITTYFYITIDDVLKEPFYSDFWIHYDEN